MHPALHPSCELWSTTVRLKKIPGLTEYFSLQKRNAEVAFRQPVLKNFIPSWKSLFLVNRPNPAGCFARTMFFWIICTGYLPFLPWQSHLNYQESNWRKAIRINMQKCPVLKLSSPEIPKSCCLNKSYQVTHVLRHNVYVTDEVLFTRAKLMVKFSEFFQIRLTKTAGPLSQLNLCITSGSTGQFKACLA